MAHFADPGIRAAFLKREDGNVCITFFDPAYALSDAIILDKADCSVHAVLHESSHFIGHISADMADAFAAHGDVTLAARRCDGRILDLKTPLLVSV